MSRPVKIDWPASDEHAICLPQQLAAAGNLILNGALVKREGSIAYAEFTSLERTVTLTSAADLSGINFTINGTLRGNVVSIPYTGPNATTDETIALFTTITSIHADAPVPADISIGSGLTGNTFWVPSDFNRSVNSATVGVNVLAGNITYSFETCLEDPFKTAAPFIFTPIDGVTIPTIPPATAMAAATVSCVANYAWPTHSSRIRVSAANATGALDFYFLEQGID